MPDIFDTLVAQPQADAAAPAPDIFDQLAAQQVPTGEEKKQPVAVAPPAAGPINPFAEIAAGRFKSAKDAAISNVGAGLGQLKDIVDQAAPGFLDQVFTPIISRETGAKHYEPSKEDSIPTGLGKAFVNKINDFAEGVTSPGMVGTVAAGGIFPQLAKPIAAGFLADTTKAMGEAAKEVKRVYDDPNSTVQQRAEADLNLAGTFAMTRSLAKHVGSFDAVPTTPPVPSVLPETIVKGGEIISEQRKAIEQQAAGEVVPGGAEGGPGGPPEIARGGGPSIQGPEGAPGGGIGTPAGGVAPEDRLGPDSGPVGEPAPGLPESGGAGDTGGYGYPAAGEPIITAEPVTGEVQPPPVIPPAGVMERIQSTSLDWLTSQNLEQLRPEDRYGPGGGPVGEPAPGLPPPVIPPPEAAPPVFARPEQVASAVGERGFDQPMTDAEIASAQKQLDSEISVWDDKADKAGGLEKLSDAEYNQRSVLESLSTVLDTKKEINAIPAMSDVAVVDALERESSVRSSKTIGGAYVRALSDEAGKRGIWDIYAKRHPQSAEVIAEQPRAVPVVSLAEPPVVSLAEPRPPTADEKGKMYKTSKWTNVVEVNSAQGNTIGKVNGNITDNGFEIKGANIIPGERGKGHYPEVLRQLAEKYGRVTSDPDGLSKPAEKAWQKVPGATKEGDVYTLEGAKIRPKYSIQFRQGDTGTERLVTVRDAEGNIIGQRDPFHPAGIPVAPKARQARITKVAGDIIKEFEKGQGATAAAVARVKTGAARGFAIPHEPLGQPDIIDVITENGGLKSKPTEGDTASWNDQPDLRGVYRQLLGGSQAPDSMAGIAAESGFGDGSVAGFWNEVGKAIDGRRKARAANKAEVARQKVEIAQGKAFAKETAAGRQEINTSNLQVGDAVTVGKETLKVTDIDPDTLDVTLEDGKKYGVQHVANNQAIYVDKADLVPREQDQAPLPKSDISKGTKAMAQRITNAENQFMEFAMDRAGLTPEQAQTALSNYHKVKAIKIDAVGGQFTFTHGGFADPEVLRRAAGIPEAPPAPVPAAAPPQLRPGEKGTADLFQAADQPFNLAGEAGIDYGKLHEQAQAQQEADHAAAIDAEKKQTVFGFGPGGASIHQPLGSHIKTLTDYVSNDLKTKAPKRSVAARMKRAVEKVGAKFVSIKEVSKSLGDNVRAAYVAMKDALLDPVKYSEFKEAVKDYHLALNQSDFETQQWVKRMEKIFKDPEVDIGLTNYTQAGGDEALLRQRAAQSDVRDRAGYLAAADLTPEQKVFAQNMGQYHSAMLDDAVQGGMLSHGLENYIKQVWKKRNPVSNKLEADLQYSRLSTNPDFARKRIFDSYFDGEQAGYRPANKKASALIAIYQQSFGRALAARAFIKSLREAKAADGKPIARFSGAVQKIGPEEAPPEAYLIRSRKAPETATTADGRVYQTVDHPALRGWKLVVQDGVETPAYYQADMLVHPDHAAHLRNLLATSRLRSGPVGKFTSPLFKVQAVAKQTKLSLSAFHLTQEGVHALSHRVLPWNLPEINFDDPTQRRIIRGGLQVADYRAQALFQEGLSGGGLVTKIPGLGKLQVKFNDWLFKDYIPRLKMKMAMEAYDRNINRYGPATKTGFTENQVAELTASQGNAAFGEMNYKLIGRSPTVQDALRLGVLAPDFLEARSRFLAQALKPYGKEQRAALMVMAAGLYVSSRVMNQILDGNPHWEKPFSFFHGGREYRLRTLLGDAFELGTDPRRFLMNRMSPISKTIATWTTGRDYRGVKLSNWEMMKDTLSWLVPISVGGTENMGTANRLLGSAGLSNKPEETPVKLTYDKARDFKGQLKDPKVQQELRRAQQETYAQSDYARLNNALQDGDNNRAMNEIVRMQKELGKTPDDLEQYYDDLPDKPFTGSDALEEDFLKTLRAQGDAYGLQTYHKAVLQREQMSKRFFGLEQMMRGGRR